jgi:hypothetical protein
MKHCKRNNERPTLEVSAKDPRDPGPKRHQIVWMGMGIGMDDGANEALAEFLKRKADWNNARRRMGQTNLFQHLRESFVDQFTTMQYRIQRCPFVWWNKDDYLKLFGDYLTNNYGHPTPILQGPHPLRPSHPICLGGLPPTGNTGDWRMVCRFF